MARAWADIMPTGGKDREVTEEERPSADLCECTEHGTLEEVDSILESGEVKDLNWKRPGDGNTALHLAVEKCDFAIVRRLIECRADVRIRNEFGLNPLALAAPSSDIFDM